MCEFVVCNSNNNKTPVKHLNPGPSLPLANKFLSKRAQTFHRPNFSFLHMLPNHVKPLLSNCKMFARDNGQPATLTITTTTLATTLATTTIFKSNNCNNNTTCGSQTITQNKTKPNQSKANQNKTKPKQVKPKQNKQNKSK